MAKELEKRERDGGREKRRERETEKGVIVFITLPLQRVWGLHRITIKKESALKGATTPLNVVQT